MSLSEFVQAVTRGMTNLEKVLAQLPKEYREKVDRCRKLMEEINEISMYLAFMGACGYRYEEEGLESARACIDEMYQSCERYYREVLEDRKMLGERR